MCRYQVSVFEGNTGEIKRGFGEEMINEVYNIDCMEFMKTCKDKKYDLAIVDPPYGIGDNWNKDSRAQFYGHKNSFNDVSPKDEYFQELFRISKNQIIWGCNYYWQFIPPSNNLIFWDKKKNFFTQHGSEGELAWTSYSKYPLLKVELVWNGCVTCEDYIRIHPHQKPIKLYKWQLNIYARSGDYILDTHVGSGSSRIACYELGFDFEGCELDADYWQAQEERFKVEKARIDGKFYLPDNDDSLFGGINEKFR